MTMGAVDPLELVHVEQGQRHGSLGSRAGSVQGAGELAQRRSPGQGIGFGQVLEHARALQAISDAREQLRAQQRLQDVVVRAGGEEALHVLRIPTRREEEHRRGGPAGIAADHPAKLHPAHVGHVHVQHDQIRLGLLEDLPEAQGIGEHARLNALRGEQALEDGQDLRIVVHRQHSNRLGPRPLDDLAHGFEDRGRGNRLVKVAGGAQAGHVDPIEEPVLAAQDQGRNRAGMRAELGQQHPSVLAGGGERQVHEDDFRALLRQGLTSGRQIRRPDGTELAGAGLGDEALGDEGIVVNDQNPGRLGGRLGRSRPMHFGLVGQLAAQRHQQLREPKLRLGRQTRSRPEGFHFERQARAFREAEGSERASQLMGLALGLPLPFAVERSLQGLGERRFEGSDSLLGGFDEAFPQPSQGQGGTLGGFQGSRKGEAQQRGDLAAHLFPVQRMEEQLGHAQLADESL
ncbi:hypothetical protein D3C87_979980 [compost metagenome]